MKYQPVDTTLMTLALYDLTQNNVATYNSAEGWFENAGKVRSKGAEAEIHATLMDNINLIGSYTYTDAKPKAPRWRELKAKRLRAFRHIWHRRSPAIPFRAAR